MLYTKYNKTIFTKSNSVTFFKDFDSLFIGGNVYIYFVYDMYKKTGVAFPNALFSNVKDLNEGTVFSKLNNGAFVMGNQGTACCPPQ